MWRQHYSGLILLTVYAYVALLSVLCSSGKWYIICLDNLGGLGTAIYSLFVFRKVSTCWERGEIILGCGKVEGSSSLVSFLTHSQ